MNEHRKNYLIKHLEEYKEHYYQMRLKNKDKKKEYDRIRYLNKIKKKRNEEPSMISIELLIKITNLPIT
jgi:hypothetical protein